MLPMTRGPHSTPLNKQNMAETLLSHNLRARGLTNVVNSEKKRHFSQSKIHTAINGRFKFSVFSGILTFIISICCRIEVINITMVESQGRGADFFSIGGKVP